MLIKNGTIIDGSGKKMFKANIRIEDDKITAIGDLKEKGEEQILDAKNLYITPGFVDILNHSDAYVTLFSNPSQDSLLQQGITTILMGNCGSSLAPLTDGIFINSIQKWGDTSKINVNWLSVAEYLNELKRHKFGVNVATLMGHSTIRRALVQDEARKLSITEQKQMNYMIEMGMREGAFGVSTGLAYSHGKNATAKELRALMGVVKKYNGLYSTHIRNEAEGFMDSIRETLSLAKETGVNTEISHFKVVEKKFWPKFKDALKLIDKVKNINFDIYPYKTTASVLYSFLPSWASVGGNSTLFPIIKDSEKKKKLISDMKKDSYSYKDMTIAMGNISSVYFGKTIGEIAKNQIISPEEATLNLILTSNNRIVVFSPTIDEHNIELGIKNKKSLVSSDGVGYTIKERKQGEFVHPRYFGAIPKFLGEFIREKKWLPWEDAVNKITDAPAQKIGLNKRGKIQKGYFADLVIFNPKLINSKATFTNPYNYPVGIYWVLVNGKIAIEKQKLQNKAGTVLLRK